MTKIFDKHHIGIRSQSDVLQICQPLFNQLNLNYFHYAHAYQDGTIFTLYSRTDWHDYFWDNDFQVSAVLPDNHLILDQAKVTLWRWGSIQQHVVDDARNLFNLDHPLSITIPQKDHFEMFAFGTDTGNDAIVNQYFSHFQTLMHFTNHFREKASHLIREGIATKRAIPKAQQAKELEWLPGASKQGMLISGNLGPVTLSPTEASVARCICWGMSSSSIATRYSRSARTIESHTNNIKRKLGVRKKQDIITTLMSQISW